MYAVAAAIEYRWQKHSVLMHLSKVLYKYLKIVLILFNTWGHKATIREETKKKK